MQTLQEQPATATTRARVRPTPENEFTKKQAALFASTSLFWGALILFPVTAAIDAFGVF